MADDPPSAIDPDGRLVVFDAGSHLHLAQGNRSWLLDHIETILDTIARPDYREDDPRAGRERFFRRYRRSAGLLARQRCPATIAVLFGATGWA